MERGNDFVSIIIPAYNRENLILKALHSIQQQTYTNWECVVVDDGSTDNTLQVVELLAKEDARFKCISNSRSKGAQGARNTGILHAKGTWIAFNDSDDEWMPDKLEKQITILQEEKFNEFLVIHGDCVVDDHKTGSREIWSLNRLEDELPLRYFLKESSILFPSILTSKKVLEEVGLLDENVPSYQEWDTALSLSRICKFVHVAEHLFIYHKHKEETISKDLRRDIEGANYIRVKYRKDFIQQFEEELYVQYFFKNLHRVVVHGYWDLGIKILKESKPFLPTNLYWHWLLSFKAKTDPLHGKKRIFKTFLRKFKKKIYG